MMPEPCASASADAIWRAMRSARPTGSGSPRASALESGSPSTYSMTMKGTWSSVSPTMNTVTMLGWLSRATLRASRWKRFTTAGSFT